MVKVVTAERKFFLNSVEEDFKWPHFFSFINLTPTLRKVTKLPSPENSPDNFSAFSSP